MGIKILSDKEEQKMIDWNWEHRYLNKHKGLKGNFTWRDIAFLLLGWIIGTSWMLVWILAYLWGLA